MQENDVRVLVTAAREVTHAAANLATVCGGVHRTEGDAAVRASIDAARAAFQLDDIYRRHNGSDTSLAATLESLETAEKAIRAARESLRTVKVTAKTH